MLNYYRCQNISQQSHHSLQQLKCDLLKLSYSVLYALLQYCRYNCIYHWIVKIKVARLVANATDSLTSREIYRRLEAMRKT